MAGDDPARAPASGPAVRVLIVEDNPADARLVVEMLREGGPGRYGVETAARLDSALERLRASPPDVLLLDLGLPDAQGLESLRRVRTQAAKVPVIILSGLRDEEVVEGAARVGAEDYLVKGHFDREILVRAIRYAMERKRTSDALRESEERFRRLLENAPDVIYRYRLGPEPAVDYVSPAVASTTGYTPEEHYADPRLPVRIVHPDDRPILERALRGDLPPGAPYVARWIHKDGRVIWTEHRIVTLRDGVGQPVAIEGISRDITGRIQAEEEIRVRTRALEAAANAVVITDTLGTILWVNPAFTSLTGYAAAEVVGQTPRVLKSGKHDRPFYEKVWKTILAGETWSGEFVNRRKDGTLYTEEATITPVRSDAGVVSHFVAIKQDVSERRRAEAARRESEERFREIAENIHEVFWITDPETSRMTYVSPAYEQIWGRTCASLYENAVSFVEAIHADDRDRVLAGLGGYARRAFDEVYRIVRPDASLRWIHARGFPIRGAGGEIVRIVGNAQDVTELKEAELQLRLQKETLQTVVDHIPVAVNFFDASGHLLFANREFERLLGWTAADAGKTDVVAACYPDPADLREVRDFMDASMGVWKDFCTRTREGRTIDTAWANVKLSDGTILSVGQDTSERRRLEAEYRQAQKMEAIGRLAGGVAHDFNNLLGVITGYSEMAIRQVDADHPVCGRINQILKAAERAASLTRQLLAFSRRQVLAPKILDLNALVSDLGQMLQRLIGEDVDFVFRPGEGSAVVRLDPGQIEQVVMNLAVNARDAMPHGGSLTIETAYVELDLALAQSHGLVPPGSYVKLSVSDTGEGIDPVNFARIFEPFFTTKPVGEGTGLGLATVYGIVQQSGGHIDVYSELGRGTTFRIYLPRVTEEAVSSAPRADGAARLTGDETILLVEDQEALRSVIGEALRDRGYAILAAESIEDALAISARHEGAIHLLLTDVVMPKVSGLELAAKVSSARPGARMLFMSGYTHDILGRQGMIASGQAFIEKPFSNEALARKVRDVLDSPARVEGVD